MPEIHLKQPRFTYSPCWPFTKSKERIQKFQETKDTKYIYQIELDKACFRHDVVYRKFKDLAKKTASDKVFRDKAFNIVKTPKYDGHQKILLVWFIIFFHKKSAGSGVAILQNQLYKSITRQF